MIKQTTLFAFLSLALAQPFTTYTYKTVDNLNIELNVYVPNSSNYTSYPIFFEVHGGGYMICSKAEGSTPKELQEALARGCVVVSIDYRLSPGVLLKDIVEDMQDAYDWVRIELPTYVNINPNSIVVFGQSAGGGLAVMAGYQLSPTPQAVISFYPFCTNFMT